MLRRRWLGLRAVIASVIRCAVRLHGRRWVLVFGVALPWRLECVYFSCAARLVGLLARAWCQGGHRRQVMVPGSRKNGAAALKPETASRMVRGLALPARGEAAEPAFPTFADVDATLTDVGQRLLHARLICGRAALLPRLPWPRASAIVRATAARRARGT